MQAETPAPEHAYRKNPYHFIDSIPVPQGFKRIPGDAFAGWLRQVALKEARMVHLYNGSLKTNQMAQFAVLDISVGNKICNNVPMR